MFDGCAVKSLSSTIGGPPDSARSRTGPFGPCGVWQLPQPMMLSTRYLPRSTAGCAPAPDQTANVTATTATAKVLFTCALPRKGALLLRGGGESQVWKRLRAVDRGAGVELLQFRHHGAREHPQISGGFLVRHAGVGEHADIGRVVGLPVDRHHLLVDLLGRSEERRVGE